MCMICLFTCTAAWGQDVALKTNGLFWLTTTPNVGVEVALSPKYTLELAGAYNPWTFKDDKKMRFWLVQPELKYWFCENLKATSSVSTCMGRSITAGSRRNAMTVIWQGAASPTDTTGFFPLTGTWRPPSASVTPACGTRRVPGPFARNATRTRRRTTSAPQRLPSH